MKGVIEDDHRDRLSTGQGRNHQLDVPATETDQQRTWRHHGIPDVDLSPMQWLPASRFQAP